MPTKIAWTNEAWNPVVGCTPVSPGCENCYAARIAYRIPFQTRGRDPGATSPYDGLTRMTEHGPRWTGEVRCLPERLGQPLHWRKPRRIFPCSMSDWLHPSVPLDFRERMKIIAALTPQHTYQSLTKRADALPAAMLARVSWPEFREIALSLLLSTTRRKQCYPLEWDVERAWERYKDGLPNWWAGVTIENRDALWRVEHLLATQAAVRWVSAEPLLEDFKLKGLQPECSLDEAGARLAGCARPQDHPLPGIDWVVIGGPTGPGAPPCDIQSIRSIVRQCRAAGVPPFVKQVGSRPVDSSMSATFGPEGKIHYTQPSGHPRELEHRDAIERGVAKGYSIGPMPLRLNSSAGSDPAEWPEDLRVREYPK